MVRDKAITLRLNEEEYRELQRQVLEYSNLKGESVPTISYIRHLLFNKKNA